MEHELLRVKRFIVMNIGCYYADFSDSKGLFSSSDLKKIASWIEYLNSLLFPDPPTKD